MENNILEKLGITPGPWELKKSNHRLSDEFDEIGPISFDWEDECYDGWLNCTEKDALVVAAAPEMLEAIIVTYELFDRIGEGNEVDAIELKHVIEKATGKSWEEIKELL